MIKKSFMYSVFVRLSTGHPHPFKRFLLFDSYPVDSYEKIGRRGHSPGEESLILTLLNVSNQLIIHGSNLTVLSNP